MSSTVTPLTRVLRAPGAGTSTLAADVRFGLLRPLKELPPKHLYDERGSQLFDQICELEEYYPTRTERAILVAHAEEIAARTGAAELIELGAGTAAKTRVLIEALLAQGTLSQYAGFDIEETVVCETARRLALEYPDLRRVEGLVGDFERDLGMVAPREHCARRLVVLLGGTIGNFETAERRRLLSSIAGLLGPDDHLLLGFDLVKEPAVIEAAYNDAAGVTAEFNRNVLTVINRELDADFPVKRFEHVAFYDGRQEWIEMRLRALEPCRVHIRRLGLKLGLERGEEIRTEISAKFTPRRLAADLIASGLDSVALMVDDNALFALALAQLSQR